MVSLIIETITTISNLGPPNQVKLKEYLDNVDTLLASLLAESHVMFKNEWEKIKLEAGHKRRSKLPD
jgi:hypothetical protein